MKMPPARQRADRRRRPLVDSADSATRSFFAVVAPGLASCTAQELRDLGLPGTTDIGGVAFEGGQRQLYQANLHLRTASRVLVRAGEFYAAAFAELRKKAGRLAWESYLRPGQPVAIHTTCHKSKLYHSDAVSERVAAARSSSERRILPLISSSSSRSSGSDSRSKWTICCGLFSS